jgi:hypothetical protein
MSDGRQIYLDLDLDGDASTYDALVRGGELVTLRHRFASSPRWHPWGRVSASLERGLRAIGTA